MVEQKHSPIKVIARLRREIIEKEKRIAILVTTIEKLDKKIDNLQEELQLANKY